MEAIFLDIETTGLDSKVHRPIDVAFKMLITRCCVIASVTLVTPKPVVHRQKVCRKIFSRSGGVTAGMALVISDLVMHCHVMNSDS